MSADTYYVENDHAKIRTALNDALRSLDRAEDHLSGIEDHDCDTHCEREHWDDGTVDGSRAHDRITYWTRRLRMGYDLGMTPLEMLDELERMLR